MASPNATFTELVSTTFRKHSKEVKDNVSKNNAFYRKLYTTGQYRKEDGGLTIVQALDYQANSTYQRFSDWDVLNISQSDVITSAEYQWRQIALNVVASGRELRINSGDSRIINLAKARTKNAIRTFKNNFSADMYSDGTLANQINGLQALVSDAGTGTVGGIDSSAWPFWQNTVQSAAAPLQGGGAVTVSPSLSPRTESHSSKSKAFPADGRSLFAISQIMGMTCGKERSSLMSVLKRSRYWNNNKLGISTVV